MLGKLKSALSRGIEFPLGSFIFRLSARRDDARIGRPNLNYSYAQSLERRFPDMVARFGLALTPDNAREVLAFYLGYLPLIHEASHGAYLRSLAQRLRVASGDEAVRAAATRLIAISDLSQGVTDRAMALRDDPQHGAILGRHVADLEAAYGAPLVTQHWPGTRGGSLIAYFTAHPEMLTGKSVMHFAPEPALRQWFKAHGTRLGVKDYVTMDGITVDVDILTDITNIRAADRSFDLVICHRVLEHIPDDAKAYSELHRILKPGGLLHMSVPQSPHLPQTAEWILPDESHDWHMRQYGADLPQRISAAGFQVELEPWLLEQPAGQLRAWNAYPMRIYRAVRIG